MTEKNFSKSFIFLLVVLAGAGFIFGFAWRQEDREKVFEMRIFDLKSNESIFIRTPNDQRILINGGANSDIIRELTKILPFYSKRIDAVIATDTNGKNVSGLIDVLKRYSVGKVILPAVTLESLGLSTTTDQIHSVFLDTIKEKGSSIEKVKEGDRVEFDSVSFDILFPAIAESFKYSKASAPELVMNISYEGNSIMVLNNVTPKIQKYIASSWEQSRDEADTFPRGLAARGDLPRGNVVGEVGETVPAGINILIIFNSASPDNLATELMDKLKPQNLIYSKSMTSSNSKSTSSKNEKPDPLFYLLDDHRFNIKEKGTIKIVSNGSVLEIGE